MTTERPDIDIELDIVAEPQELAMAERGRFEIGIVARNRGMAVVDPELHRARLFVNGEDSLAWGDAIGNGLREPAWDALPPGESVSMRWPSMGELLFPAPGDYTLVLRHGDVESEAVVVQVRR